MSTGGLLGGADFVMTWQTFSRKWQAGYMKKGPRKGAQIGGKEKPGRGISGRRKWALESVIVKNNSRHTLYLEKAGRKKGVRSGGAVCGRNMGGKF